MASIHVLLLEDDPADARLVELMLRKVIGSPFTVELATRLAEALARLAAGPVDVVLADLSLPDSTGLATLKALTQAAADLPVVVLTGNDDDTQAIDALKHGAQDYLVKGRGDGFILSRVIRYAIERKSGERALKEARDRAEAAVRAKSVFLATIGHEIRTPLNGVLGMARLLLDTNLDQRQRTFADTVLSSGELLLGLVNDILDFSRLEAEGVTLENVAFDLVDLVEELRLMMAPRAAEKGLTLGCRLPRGDIAMVEGDPLRLRQVLLNLVGNAIKFTERGGVMITVHPDGNAEDGRPIKRFIVADTGQGVPDASDDLFTEFSQGDSSITRRYGGAGLGLAICKRLVTLMGGEIGFDSISGQGASFWFTVPLAAATQRRPEPAPKAWAATFRILLVDDNAVNREVAAGLLGRHGHEVAAFEDGPGGIAALATAAWDLVLLDMHMPDMDGIETARRMRALGGGAASVPVWLLTANPVEQDAKLWRDAGIDGCLAKPFRVEDVATVLAERDRAAGPANNTGGVRLLNLPDLLADLKDLGHERMKGLAELFERSAGQDLKTVLERARANDADGLAAIVHRLASAASSLHLVALNERCRAVETAARAHDAGAFALAEGLAELWTRSLKALTDVVH